MLKFPTCSWMLSIFFTTPLSINILIIVNWKFLSDQTSISSQSLVLLNTFLTMGWGFFSLFLACLAILHWMVVYYSIIVMNWAGFQFCCSIPKATNSPRLEGSCTPQCLHFTFGLSAASAHACHRGALSSSACPHCSTQLLLLVSWS